MRISPIGARIFVARKTRYWTQGELAERIDSTAASVSRWENGLATPSFDAIYNLACALEVKAGWLAFGDT